MRRFPLFGWMLIAILLVSSATPILAADDAHGSANPLEIMYDTALWAIVVFVALLLILRKTAWDPILEGLQKREDTIRSSVEEAGKTRAEMEQLRDQFRREMAEAQQQIPKLMEDARKKGDEMVAQKIADAAAKIQADQERFRHDMQTAKDQAIRDLWDQAAQLATLISAKVIGRSLNEDDHRRLLDESMAEMRRPGSN